MCCNSEVSLDQVTTMQELHLGWLQHLPEDSEMIALPGGP
jgi:hypothetical protein